MSMSSTDGGRLIPVQLVSAFIAVTEEMLIDLGYPPPPGYWERELTRQIERRRVRTRLRVQIYRARWLLASLPRRAAHVRDAILDRPCCEEDL